MTNKQEIGYILGIQVQKNFQKKIIIVTQAKYISNLLTKLNMHNCKPLMEADIKYTKTMAFQIFEDKSFMKTILYTNSYITFIKLEVC